MINKDKLGTYILMLLILTSLIYKSYDLFFSSEAKARTCVSHFLKDIQNGGTGEQYLASTFNVSVENRIKGYSFMMTQKCTQPNTYIVNYRIKNIKNIVKTTEFEVVNDKIVGVAESF